MDNIYDNVNKFNRIGYEYLKDRILSNTGIYNYLNDIESGDFAKYILVILITIIGISTITISYHVITGLIIGMLIVYYMIDKENTLANNLNKKLDDNLLKLNSDNVKYIYQDIDILNIYSNIVEYKVFNKTAFNQSLRHIDNMIKIHQDLKAGVKDYKHNLDIAQQEGVSALNSLTSIIINIPVSQAYDKDISPHIKNTYDPLYKELMRPRISKLKRAVDLLRKLINKHVNDMADICYNRYITDTITTSSSPIDIEYPKPFDVKHNINYDIYN